jgi:hypothetical protein
MARRLLKQILENHVRIYKAKGFFVDDGDRIFLLKKLQTEVRLGIVIDTMVYYNRNESFILSSLPVAVSCGILTIKSLHPSQIPHLIPTRN